MRNLAARLAVAVTVVAFAPGLAHAYDRSVNEPRESVRFDGGFLGVGLEGGALQRLVTRPGEGSSGFATGLRLRAAPMTHVIDGEVGFNFARAAGPTTLSRSSLGASLNLHPVFPFLLFNTRFYWAVGGWHLTLGGSADRLGRSGGGVESVDWTWGLHVGTGVDVPISSLDRPDGWWLSVRLRYRFGHFGWDADTLGLNDLMWLAALEYRSYDMGFAPIHRPFKGTDP
jgi:hypothetical protein